MSRSRARDLFDMLVANGEARIDEMITEQFSEELFLDYKRSSNTGESRGLDEADRVNYGRAISGFGNSEGGVIVWGVECRRDRGDLPEKKVPITEPKRFLAALEGATTGCTLPPHDGVLHYAVERPNSKEGFVISYIPKSMKAPHQCIAKGKSHERYLMRAGSDFLPVPHGLLSGMFGRRPSPKVVGGWRYSAGFAPLTYEPVFSDRPTNVPHLTLTFNLKNEGLLVVRDLYANFWARTPGSNFSLYFDHADPKFESHHSKHRWNMIGTPTFRLAPVSETDVFTISMYLHGHVSKPFNYEVVFGCSESIVHRMEASVPPDLMNAAYDEYSSSNRDDDAADKFAKNALDLERMIQNYERQMED